MNEENNLMRSFKVREFIKQIETKAQISLVSRTVRNHPEAFALTRLAGKFYGQYNDKTS